MLLLPAVIVPVLEGIVRLLRLQYSGLGMDIPLEFWNANNSAICETGFYDLADEIMLSDSLTEGLKDMPIGYSMVAHLFTWESGLSADGWGVLENYDEGFVSRVCDAYIGLGFADESLAVSLAYKEWINSGFDIDSALRKYRGVSRVHSNEEERIALIVQKLSNNSLSLLYEDVPASSW